MGMWDWKLWGKGGGKVMDKGRRMGGLGVGDWRDLEEEGKDLGREGKEREMKERVLNIGKRF